MVKLSELDLKEFSSCYEAWKTAKSAYYSVKHGDTYSLSSRLQDTKAIKVQKDLEQKHRDALACSFVNWLRQQTGYKQAIESLRKKISNFPSIGEHGQYNDQLYFNHVCAKAFQVYIDTSKGSIDGWTLSISRIKRAKTLALQLRNELEKFQLFAERTKHKHLYNLLSDLSKVKSRPQIYASKKHTKLPREVMTKVLAFRLLDHWRPSEFKRKGSSFVDVITHIVSLIDPDVDKRRIAEIVNRIKPELKAEHRYWVDHVWKLDRYDELKKRNDSLEEEKEGLKDRLRATERQVRRLKRKN